MFYPSKNLSQGRDTNKTYPRRQDTERPSECRVLLGPRCKDDSISLDSLYSLVEKGIVRSINNRHKEEP